MSLIDNTATPLPYKDWVQSQNSVSINDSFSLYRKYIKEWYDQKTLVPDIKKYNSKQDFIQLLRDLSFLFGQEDEDPFIKEIDYNNDEDLIIAIPYFVRKLKQLTQTINAKREAVKGIKTKYNSIGSNAGLEKLLQDYLLQTFSKNNGSLTQIPFSSLQSVLPELSAIKNDFFLEIEELHDFNNGHDKDPSVDYLSQLNSLIFSDSFPLNNSSEKLSVTNILDIISSGLLPKVSNNPSFNIFRRYLSELSSSTNEDKLILSSVINSEVEASLKYLGETFYSLSAVKFNENFAPNFELNLNLTEGNNWFLWPGGTKVLDNKFHNNLYQGIKINDSNLSQQGATPGNNYSSADIIFTDKNGIIEGAWFRDLYYQPVSGNISINLKRSSTTEFLFPFVGFDINTKNLKFQNFKLEETNFDVFNYLSVSQQQSAFSDYYTQQFPLTSSNSIYLNNTNLASSGAFAGKFSDDSDSIIRRPHNFTLPKIHSDSSLGTTEAAFLYKFDRTDIPILKGESLIDWPIGKYETTSTLNLSYKSSDVLPISLADINPAYTMSGAVAGGEGMDGDVIYKLLDKLDTTSSIEGAWLGGAPLSRLNILTEDIPIYNTPATVLSHPISGVIQGSLAFKAEPGIYTSFVWCGKDTYADEVFKFTPHDDSCEFGKNFPHNYNNTNSLNCTCKAVNYSPIGHISDYSTDNSSVIDYLFADPEGLSDKFTRDSWRDTRGNDYTNSPQFSFFLLDDLSGKDTPFGFGPGKWTTTGYVEGDVGYRMVLKTGRRYTYLRSSLFNYSYVVSTSDNTPPLITNRQYEDIPGDICDNNELLDVIICVDVSRSQSENFDKLKTSIKKIIDYTLLENETSVQIGLVFFGLTRTVLSYLTTSKIDLISYLDDLQILEQYPDYTTSIYEGLLLSDILLFNSYNLAQAHLFLPICKSISFAFKQQLISNAPKINAKKKIVLISDGEESVKNGTALELAKELKGKGVEICGINNGPLSLQNNLVKTISSDYRYFNLYRYLISGDGDYNSFEVFIGSIIRNCTSLRPIWKRLIKSYNNSWIPTEDISDMVLNPGDHLLYSHRVGPFFSDAINSVGFSQPGISFTINVKLDGWDYNTHSLSLSNIGPEYGAKPFWAVIPTDPIQFGGNVYFVDECIPVHQPLLSNMQLNNADFIQYNSVNPVDLYWKQPLDFNVQHLDKQWCNINFTKKLSNLADFLKNDKIDTFIELSNTPSSMILESYSQYKPAYYHYIARNDFTFTQGLFLIDNCKGLFSSLTTAVAIEPYYPYANLDNRFYPSVANVSFPILATTEKQTGWYFLPSNLGTSTFRGRGYEYDIDQTRLYNTNLNNTDLIYTNPSKYGTSPRGLTHKDQYSPMIQTRVNASWVMLPFGNGQASGTMTGVRENQKFTPYQTEYEIRGLNTHGLARQDDKFQFWDVDKNLNAKWNLDNNHQPDLKANTLNDRSEQLLCNKGELSQWRTDIFGNDYGLYKN